MSKYKIFGENIEQLALDQFESAIENDWVVKGALMPDAHAGYALPIGSVVATENVIIPSWVGYDIGCGMCAQKTDYKKADIERFQNTIFNEIYRTIPVGFNRHEKDQNWDSSKLNRTDFLQSVFDINGLKQLGTLGGGNHFIEIGYDELDCVWIIIHSGSRNLGHKTATHYMKKAGGGKCREGHYPLDSASQDGKDYITDLNFCLEFALENRKQMMNSVHDIMIDIIGSRKKNFGFALINRNHNHATYDANMNLWIHRKGATHAEKDMHGVIPGNMRDGSFIVRGLGNSESLCSSSHGAGRVMSRTKAKELINLDDFESKMEGIVAKVDKDTIDESPGAYKDIFEVMRLQSDLVDVLHHIKPLINIKG